MSDPEIESPSARDRPHYVSPNNAVEHGLAQQRGEGYLASLKYRAEIPVAVPDRGGAAPTFIEVREEKETTIDGVRIYYRPHWFNVLSAIDDEIGRARTSVDLTKVALRYLVDKNRPLDLAVNYADLPTLDPNATLRIQAFVSAMTKRQQTLLAQIIAEVDAHAQTALKEEVRKMRQTEGKCRAEHIPRRGGNAEHNSFADLVTAGTMDYLLSEPSGISTITDGLDAKDPKLVWEVKTRHDFLTEWALPGTIFSPAVQGAIMDMEDQRMRHMSVAERCGYKVAYAFDTPEVADFFRRLWNNSPPVTAKHRDSGSATQSTTARHRDSGSSSGRTSVDVHYPSVSFNRNCPRGTDVVST